MAALSQSKEISSDLCSFCKGGISHNDNNSFQKFIVVSSPTALPYRNKDMEISCESTAGWLRLINKYDVF